MPIYSDVITRLDERAAQVAADQIERQFGDAGRGASTALQREIGSGLTGLRGLVNEFGSGLRSGIDSHLRGVGSSFDAVSSKASGIGLAGLAAVGGVAAIGTAAAVVGKQFYDLGAQWDAIADGITVRTGKIGAELKALTDVVGDVGSTTAASLGSIGDIVGQISQSMPDLAANNGAVRQMASNLAYLDANGQAVNIRELGKAFDAFGVNAADQVGTLDKLNNVSQATGIPINQLIGTIKDGAPQFKQFGLDVGGATGLIAAFEDAGLNSDVAVTGLRIALTKVGDDARGAGPALADAVTQIKALHDAGQEGAARQLAQDVFGTRNFGPFLDAIESGRLGVDGLNKALEQTGLTIADMQSATDDGAQGFTKLKNTAATMLKPIGDFLFSNVNQPLLLMQENLQKATDGLKDLATVPITSDSALGKLLLPAGGLPGMAGIPQPTGIGSAFGAPATPGAPNTGTSLKPYSWGTDPLAPPGAGGGPKLPSAPAVPYDSTLPPGFAGLPQTAELYSAESSFLDARHSAAEKRARLNQLERDNAATADDITNARNDVLEAERGQNEAELRLYNTQNKQLKDHTQALGEFGAKLDQDLGISKGLAGIADNLVRFLGNLALAPAMAQMNAISAASPSQGGFGLMGMMGAQGAFGPQFTGIDPSKQGGYGATGYGGGGYGPSGMGPSASSGGMPQAGTPNPGESARDFAHRVMMPFWQNQGLQVGDHAADKYGEHQNGALDIMVDSLAEGNKVLQQVLSDPNAYGAIFNNQTYGYGHGTTPQPYGSTGGPTDKHEDHVHAWYKPGGSGNIAPPIGGGGGGGAAPTGLAGSLYQGAGGQWRSGLPGWDHLIQRESNGVNQPQGITDVNSGGNEAEGLFQITPKTWAAHGGTQYAPSALGATPQQQADIAAAIFGANPSGSDWGAGLQGRENPAQLSGELQGSGTWGGPGIPSTIMPGAGGQSPVWGASPQGPGLGASATAGIPGGPGVGGAAGGPGVGPTTIGGVDPLQGTGKGGIGMTPGGSLDTALGIGASMFPGLGQAAQTGVKLASRAIQYGGQVAGIMTQGALDTFLPMGGSQLAQNSWLTRIVGGLAGAAPALPNMAGKSSQPQGPKPEAVLDPNAPQQPKGGPGQGGDTHITVNNQRATEDGTGRDVAHAMQNQYAMPGMP